MIAYQELNPKGHPVPQNYLEHSYRLYYVLNVIRAGFSHPITVSRAFVTKEEQAKTNPEAPLSAHLTFQAADLVTVDNARPLWVFLMENYEKYVIGLDIYLEEKLYTPRHVHLQIRKVPSGNRIYKP